MTDTFHSDVNLIPGKKSRHVKYEFRVADKNNGNIVGIRKSKKGGSTYSNALLDLIYMIGKLDPYFWDKLVNDKQFPEMVSQMQEAYARKSLEPGWSPEQVKELEVYAIKRKEEVKKE